MSSTLTRSCVALLGLLLLAATPAEAQLKGLGNRAKKAVEAVTGGSESGAPAAASSAGVYNEHVLEMTPEVVERFERALRAEDAGRQDVARVAASVRTPEAYEACMMGAMSGADAQALLAAMTEKGEAYLQDPSDAAATAAHQKAQQDLTDYMSRTCGPDPEQFQATELPKLQARPARVGLEAGGFTVTQYAILKERIAPLCGMAAAAGDEDVRIPGEGENIFWVYSPGEVETLLPRCGELSRLVEAGL